jgi:DNA-binding response OmpR family regulator
MSSQRRERSSTQEISLERPCVLIVDDEIAIRSAIGRYFSRQGWDVREASDGEAARRLLEPNAGASFDVVICDLHMPRFSGFAFYRWLAGARPDAAARVVFSSGDVESHDTAQFLRDVRRPVLPKPFDLCELDRVIDEVRAARAA